jgi:GH15 family glucan-1,4-alpha-glucosidase
VRVANGERYPAIGDYALISDSNSVALVSRDGSIDWCCIQRIDSGSCFGRLLDRERGGYCSISSRGEDWTSSRRYVDDSLVLETTFNAGSGEVRVLDFFALPVEERRPYRQLIRIVEGVRGHVELDLEIAPRFDYGGIKPWIRQEDVRLFSAIGGDDGLLISSDAEFSLTGHHDLVAYLSVRAGERVRLSMMAVPPELLDNDPPEATEPEEIDRRLEEALEGWRGWSSQVRFKEGSYRPGVLRSALVLKALKNDLTGAIAAAPTTSLPESPGGTLNWDYRYTWLRDSFFSVQALAEIGFTTEADDFRRFVQRSAAGSAEDLQIMYGVGGERRLTEVVLDHLEGYRGASPVRAGNAAFKQPQLGVYGQLLELSWRWHGRGNSPDDDYWRFLLELVDSASRLWSEPDRGIWEVRGEPLHFVYSKAMCWAALDRGIRLAGECMRRAPERRWKKCRDEIRAAIEGEGYDEERGVFVQAFGNKELDASLLLLPQVSFVDYKDKRMVRTTDAIREELDDDGLIKRYLVQDGEQEGAFLACSFWLAECFAYQGRLEEAVEVFDRAVSTGNDLGLFAEEYDTEAGEMLGNFPQALTHLSHISAAVALAEHLERG